MGRKRAEGRAHDGIDAIQPLLLGREAEERIAVVARNGVVQRLSHRRRRRRGAQPIG